MTYSRSRGVFGGLDLGGATIAEDKDSNRELFTSGMTNKEILNGKPTVPPEAETFVSTLEKLSSRRATN